ncbi:hypothetical protein SAMN05428949_6133 [Chitinophaga sp. YR627]|uniref:hypothetical protein n=1 Tax=Chitinophaga sp. YR627 TaxID=1881041 RepID=UPI0008F27D89|nr:hypothetical protein [Chitinophaga sp. YR627]SFO67852.1 hypothetical protein SAMN05428949_6133 [Chitinophaga sp. YR627]
MKKVFTVLLIILSGAPVFLEIYFPELQTLQAILYAIGAGVLLYQYWTRITKKNYQYIEGPKEIAFAVLKVFAFYACIWRGFLYSPDWLKYPLFLLIPWSCYWILGVCWPFVLIRFRRKMSLSTEEYSEVKAAQ